MTETDLTTFLLLAKSTNGASTIELIKQVLDTKGIYAFTELLEIDSVAKLQHGSAKEMSYFNLLKLFAFDTFMTFNQNREKYLELSPNQLVKLKQLSFVTLASKNTELSYDFLMKELDFKTYRELEDFVMNAINNEVVHAKINPKLKMILVDYTMGRDVSPEGVDDILNIIGKWNNQIEQCLHMMDQEISKSRQKQAEVIRINEEELNRWSERLNFDSGSHEDKMDVDEQDTPSRMNNKRHVKQKLSRR